jgi:predicted O-methyltransferase YrrM
VKDRAGAILRREQERYLERLLPPRDPLLVEMEEAARRDGVPISDPEVGRLLELLARATRARLVVEVGTAIGYGTLCLARGAPEARIVTIDNDPERLAQARAYLERGGVADRVELVPGSFFDVVPKGADAYLMKNILHDWDDERSTRILKNVRAATERGQKVLVCEAIVEPDSEDFGALSDIQMMVVCGEGRERSRADFERLFAASGFRLERIIPTPTLTQIVEAIAQ